MSRIEETVLRDDFCVGCGACASQRNTLFQMEFQEKGNYLPVRVRDGASDEFDSICPFSDSCRNEDELGKRLFSGQNLNHDENIGYSIASFAGYAKEGKHREKGSSGGMVTWLAAKLLEEGLADSIIHVKPSDDGDCILFKYAISSTVQELQSGAKSKYYPVEISQVMHHVLQNDGRYAFIGVPCFVKAVRLLAEKEPVIHERIKYTIGLVCGHLKTDRFAKAMAWEMGIPPESLTGFDFRVKTENQPASHYHVEATGLIDGQVIRRQRSAKELFVSNWGHGFFKLKACDYCDDVVAETADVSIGDAWLPEYVSDPAGNSVVVVRNQKIMDLIQAYNNDLKLDLITSDKIYQSQAGGYRHRRQGLAFRLYLLEQEKQWHPGKRVQASNTGARKRKKMYENRIALREESHKWFYNAEAANEFQVFVQHMKPYICEYEKLYRPAGPAFIPNIAKRIGGKLFRQLKLLLHRSAG